MHICIYASLYSTILHFTQPFFVVVRSATGKPLRDWVVDELEGNMEDFVEYTQMEEAEFDAIMLYEAFKGLGCDEKAVVEVLTTRSWKRLHNARCVFANDPDFFIYFSSHH